MMPDKQEQGPDGQGGLQLQADCERALDYASLYLSPLPRILP